MLPVSESNAFTPLPTTNLRVRADTGVCPYGWMSACSPLLLEGGVRGEARGGSDEGSAATEEVGF